MLDLNPLATTLTIIFFVVLISLLAQIPLGIWAIVIVLLFIIGAFKK